MPRLLPIDLRDRQDLNLPASTTRSFWLNGSSLEYPTFDLAETFIAHLVRRGRYQLSISLQIDPPLSFPYKTLLRR